MPIVEAKLCNHVRSVSYWDKHWFITYADGKNRQVFLNPVVIPYHRCPHCETANFARYQRYAMIEKLPVGRQD